jgi:hypothetical protein
MTVSREPSLVEVLRIWEAAHDARLRVCLPGRVERYDATQRRADVKPLLKASYVDAAGARRADSLPVVPSVPVVFPGAGGFTLTFPVQPGDTVLLVFADESLDRWLARGGEVDPGEVRPHDLSNAVALVGLQDFAHALAAHADNVVLGKSDGARVELTPSGNVVLNGGTARVAREGDAVSVDLSGMTLNGTVAGSPASFTVLAGTTAAGEITEGADGVLA